MVSSSWDYGYVIFEYILKWFDDIFKGIESYIKWFRDIFNSFKANFKYLKISLMHLKIFDSFEDIFK